MADTPISVPAGRLELTDDSLKMLLHMDGADASTTFTDECGKTITSVGNVQIDTAQSVIGGASGLFDGTGDYLTTPHNSVLDFAANDFTIEMYIRYASLGASKYVYIKRPAAANRGIAIFKDASQKINFFAGDSNTTSWNMQITGATTLLVDTWYHVAFVRSGSTWTVYLNGVSDGTASASFTVDTASGTQFIGATDSGGSVHNGFMDELAVFNGRSLYKSQFTPRTTAISFTRPTITATTGMANIAVPAGAAAITGYAANISRFVLVSAGVQAITGQAVTLEISASGVETPGAGALTILGYAPALGIGVAGQVGSATVVGSTPIVNVAYSIAVQQAVVVITGQDVLAVVPQYISSVNGAGTFIAAAPTAVVGVVRQVGSGSAVVTGAAASNALKWTVPSATVAAIGQTPACYIGKYTAVSAGSHSFTGQVFGGNTGYAVGAGSTTITGAVPTVAQGKKISVAGAASAAITGSSISIPVIASPSYNIVNIDALF